MPDWNVDGRWRRDGLAVIETLGGVWIVLPGDDSPPMDICPCCNMPLVDAQSARVAADKYYPLAEAA